MKHLMTILLVMVGAASPALGPVTPLGAESSSQRPGKIQPLPDVAPPAPKATIRVTTTLVEVSVTAKDKLGQPVTDLKQNNFELYDEGKRQKIQFFTVQRVSSIPAARAPTTTRPSVPAGATSPLATQVFANRSSKGPTPNAVTVILIDEINMMCEQWPWVRSQLVKFLRQVEPGDRIGIYVMTPSGMNILHEITQDCSALVERLASWKGESAQTRCMAGDRLYVSNAGSDLGFVLYGSGPAPGVMGVPSRGNLIYFGAGNPNWDYAILSLEALGAIAKHLAGIPGRKNIIWLSNGVPVSDIYYPYEQDALRAANQANVAIYSVEAQGLKALMPSYPGATAPSTARLASPSAPVGADVANMDMRHPLGQQWQVAVQDMHNALLTRQEALMEVSERTGGRAFVNTNDIAGAICTAFDDSRTTYTLGFYPDTPQLEGQFHRLQIKVVGRSDVSLNYRRGYMNAQVAGDFGNLLRDAVWSPLDANGIALTAEMTPNATGYDLSVTVGLDGLNLHMDGKRWKGALHMVLVQNDDQGGRYDYLDQTLDVALKQGTYKKALQSGLPFHQAVAINPQATSLRVIVLDEGSGNLGSLTIPLASSKSDTNKPS